MSQEQARHPQPVGLALLACTALLTGCADPLGKPIDLFHGLEGGQIAAERPPPPGAGQPYPHIGTVPDRPTLPTQSFRTALYSQLAAERDQKELLAADMPLEKVPPPPTPLPPKPAAPPAASEPPATAGTPTTAETPTPNAADTGDGNATSAADAGGSNATIAAADAPPAGAAGAAPPQPPAPPQDAGLQIAGDPVSTANLPLVPDAPPPPPALSGVAAQPAPTRRLLPAPNPLPPGKPVFFANGSDTVQPSQKETLQDLIGSRGKRTVDIIGLGDADSDTPLGQEAAIDLGLRRARAIAAALSAMHVPDSAVRISARPFGRGALVRLLP
jgi:outer membrane protein OmpA-like peptidoglycan-associated protein